MRTEENLKARIDKFEDLIAWKKARKLTREIYQVTRKNNFASDFGLSSQIQRAAVSIMSNIAEGFERASRAEFHLFLVHAKASCAEVRSQLYIAFDIGYLGKEQFENLLGQTNEVGRIVGGLRAAVQRQKEQQRMKQ